jgi:hypothetical protein
VSETPDIEKIVIHYTDGTTKEVHKGFIANMEINESNQEAEMTFLMTHMSGTEMRYIVNGMVEFGYKAGFFEDKGVDN